MNKEEFIDTLQACYFGDRGAFNKILKEYEELHNKIDKAIEYIENADWYLPLWECRDNQPDKNILLEILKDSDVNE